MQFQQYKHEIQIKNRIRKGVNVNVIAVSGNVNYRKRKKDCSCNFSTCTCKNSKNLKSIADTSLIEFDKTITVMYIVSTKLTNTTGPNVTTTASISCRSKKVRGCYIMHKVLLLIVLLLIIIGICYYAEEKGTI